MRFVLFALSAGILAWTIGNDAARAAGEQGPRLPQRPNIVFILADDLGYGDVGCYGQTKIKTPNIDRMAVDGIRFTQAYAGCTVCGPSRSVLMTGQHTGHTRVRGNNCFAGGILQGNSRRMNLTDQDVTHRQCSSKFRLSHLPGRQMAPGRIRPKGLAVGSRIRRILRLALDRARHS